MKPLINQHQSINFKAFVYHKTQCNVERWSPMKTGVYCRKKTARVYCDDVNREQSNSVIDRSVMDMVRSGEIRNYYFPT